MMHLTFLTWQSLKAILLNTFFFVTSILEKDLAGNAGLLKTVFKAG